MPNVNPAARVAAPTSGTSTTEPRRFFGRFEGALEVVLDASGNDGAFSGEVALDSFTPPLSRAQLEGLAMRVALPPNTAGTMPVELIERNGRPYLRVAVEKGNVGLLMGSPMAIAVGQRELLGQAGGTVSAPQFMLQVNAGQLRVDRTAPTLRMELDARAQAVRTVDSARRDVTSLRDGTSGWFGGRQLEQERAGLVARVAETAQAVAALRADLEARFEAAAPVLRLMSMPTGLASRENFLAAHNAAIAAKAALVDAQALRRSFVELSLPAELPEHDAKIAALEQAVAAGVSAEAEVRALYAAARRDAPAQADAWLGALGQLQRAPDLDGALAAAGRARDALALNEADAAQVAANNARNLPGALANAEALLARVTKQLADSDARIAALRTDSGRDIIVTSPTHAADLEII